jgi:ribose 1,5-bisphosphokinase
MTPAPIAHAERLIVVVGPSGAGKDSVLRAWHRLAGSALHVAQRVITRPADVSENCESVTGQSFERLLADNQLATWWRANGLSYGIRHSELALLAEGHWVAMNSSRAHLPVLRAQAPQLHCIEITAAPALRLERIAARGREGSQDTQSRLSREFPVEADLTLANDGALGDTVGVLHAWWRSMADRARHFAPD